MKDNLLLEEFKQAWEQHRHLDNIRAKYLGLMYTISFAGIALIGTVSEQLLKNNIEALLFSLFVSIIAAISILQLGTLINDIRNVFPHYEEVWKKIRIQYLNSEHEKWLNVRNHHFVKNRASTIGKLLEHSSRILFWLYFSITAYLIMKLPDAL